MWHHRSVFPSFSLRLRLLASVLAILSLPLHAQTHQHPAGNKATPAPFPSSPARDMLAELAKLLQVQAAAVNAGDPVTIADASRRLNAQIYLLLAQFRLAQGKPQEAIDLYRQSLALAPSTARRLEFASALLRSGNTAAAIGETDAVIAEEPNNANAWMIRGSALRDAGRGKEAVDAHTHALELRSDSNTAFALGATYLSLHEKAKADAIFHRLIEVSGQTAIWYIAIGDAYRDAGYMEDAVASLKAGLVKDPMAPHGEFFLGLTYLQMNQWGPNSDSFQHLRKAVAQSPHEYVSNFYLGALESTDGSDLPSSDQHLHAAAEADPTQPEVWLYLGNNANREHNAAEAKLYLQKSIDLTGTDEARNGYQVRRAYFALGRLLIAEGHRPEGEALLARYKAAEQAAVALSGKSIAATEKGAGPDSSLSSLAAVVPPSASAELQSDANLATRKLQDEAEARLHTLLAASLNDLGTAEARQHDYDAALRDFQQSTRWDDTNSLVLRNLGVAAFRLKDNAEAARALALYRDRQAAAKQPIDGHAQLMLALAQFEQGNFAESSRSFAPVESLALEDPSTAYSYAFALARSGRSQEANHMADVLSAKALAPDLLPLVCHLYIDTENYAGSQTCYRKALQSDPHLALAHYEIGESLIHLDRPAEAIPELREELAQTPDNPNVRTSLAFALLQTSQKAEARALLEATTKEHPEHAQAQYEFGKLLLAEGDVNDSIPHLEASEQADGSRDYVHYQLGTAYRKAGRTSDAEREFKTYREIKDKSRDANAVPPAEAK